MKVSSRAKAGLHWAAAAGAAGLGILIMVKPAWQTSVLLVVWLSVYAILVGHLAAAEAARPDPGIMRELRLLRSELAEVQAMVTEIRNRT